MVSVPLSSQSTDISWLLMIECASMIGYPNYKFYFPIRALGRYEHDYVPHMKENNLFRKK